VHGEFQTPLPTRCIIEKHEQEVQNFNANKLCCKKITHKKFENENMKPQLLVQFTTIDDVHENEYNMS
jgi:hypothetical protein